MIKAVYLLDANAKMFSSARSRYVGSCDHSDAVVVIDKPQNFKAVVEKAGLTKSVVYLDRGDAYSFHVRSEESN